MFWAAFGYGIRTDLVVLTGDPESIKGGVTARIYCQVLSDYLPTVLDYDSIFMHDGASIHTAKIVRQWLEDNDIEVMDSPPYSPDLNPIENLWFLLKEAILKRCLELLTTTGEEGLQLLIQTAKDAWEDLYDELLNKLSDTMCHRVQAVLDAEGWYTKY